MLLCESINRWKLAFSILQSLPQVMCLPIKIFLNVKPLSRIGWNLLFSLEARMTNYHWKIYYSFYTFLELVVAHTSIGNFCFPLLLSACFLRKFSCYYILTDVYVAGSFLRKLYTSYQECPRSYDKLRFDPRWFSLKFCFCLSFFCNN